MDAMDDTTAAAAFKAAIQRLCSGGMGDDILAKAFTGEEDSMAETNTCNGSAMLHFYFTDECNRKMRADEELCTKESISNNETKTNSKKNLTSERIIANISPPTSSQGTAAPSLYSQRHGRHFTW